MKKRFYLLLLLTSSLLIIYFFDNYLSTKVNNLTTVNYVCYLYNNEKCENEWTSQHHNKDYKDTEQNDITFKEYEFSPSESDYKNDKITVSKQVQREGNLLNKDMYYLANQYKDISFTDLDRAHDYYPSKYKRDSSTINILAISDSYGVGAGLINTNDTWIGVLEQKMLEQGYNVSINRLVKNGADFPDFLEMISKKNIKKLDPDIILLSVFHNDLDPLRWVSEPEYLKCLSRGFGGNILDKLARSKLPHIYSLILSRNCDPKKLEDQYWDRKVNNARERNYIKLSDDPLAQWYKQSMEEILENAEGRPIIIQPLFDSVVNYDSIKDYLSYLNSIGYIIPNFNEIEIVNYAVSLNRKIMSHEPIDGHYSRIYNNYISSISYESIKNYLKTKKNLNFKDIDLKTTPSIISTAPLSFIHDKNLLLKYENPVNANIVTQLSPELKRAQVTVGEKLDNLLCTTNNRPSVRAYLNQIKHSKDTLSITLQSSESQIALSGIYYSSAGEELFTEIQILKPGEIISFSPERKIIGLLFGSPKSGCAQDQIWSMPSFIAQLSYN